MQKLNIKIHVHCSSNVFHGEITLVEKKFLRISFLHEFFFSLSACIHVIPPGSSRRLPEMGLTSQAPGKDVKPPGS